MSKSKENPENPEQIPSSDPYNNESFYLNRKLLFKGEIFVDAPEGENGAKIFCMKDGILVGTRDEYSAITQLTTMLTCLYEAIPAFKEEFKDINLEKVNYEIRDGEATILKNGSLEITVRIEGLIPVKINIRLKKTPDEKRYVYEGSYGVKPIGRKNELKLTLVAMDVMRAQLEALIYQNFSNPNQNN